MFHLEKLKDSSCAHEYVVTFSNLFEVLNTLEDPVELWDTFKHEILEAARGCVGGHPRPWGGFATAETLDSVFVMAGMWTHHSTRLAQKRPERLQIVSQTLSRGR